MKNGCDIPTLEYRLRQRGFLVRLWALIKPYWFSDDRWRGRGLLLLVVALTVASVYLNVALAEWNRLFFDAIQAKNYADFLQLLGRFCILAAFYILFAAYGLYFSQMLQIRWRRWLTEQYYRDWLADRSYYLLQLEKPDLENPEQRIQDDLGIVTTMTLTLGVGLLNSVLTLGSFLVLLWNLSGTLRFHLAGMAFAIPGYMVWLAIIYSAAGSVATHYVGRSLIGINFDLQKYSADFRFRMIRVRENAESVALYGGEADEEEKLKTSFGRIWQTWWRLMKTQKRLNFFTSGYEQAAVIFPFLAAAPRYFSGAIKLGGLTMTSVAFGQVQTSLSWFVGVYPDIAEWSASVKRLISFGEALVETKRLASSSPAIRVNKTEAPDLSVNGVSLSLPDQRLLLEGISLRIRAGEGVVVCGPSGAGKSTLFRALAGIWPYGSGTVSMPRGRVLFLPQKPYLPIASLREVLSYPEQAQGRQDEAYRLALADAGLPQLSGRLDEERNWSLGLSGGEQQKISFARAFLYRPQWLFMDEATSALDEPAEQALYAILRERLPGVTIISVAHRAGVARFHRRRLTVRPETSSLVEDLVTDPDLPMEK